MRSNTATLLMLYILVESGNALPSTTTSRATASTTLSTTTSAATSSEASAIDLHEWRKPGPNDSRSPCPGLNTVANHGYLPRDGRNISTSDIAKAFWDAYGATADIALGGMLGGTFPQMITPHYRIDLEHLNKHIEFGEHDLSWSREDARIGDSVHFNQTLWDQSMSQLHDPVTIVDLSRARVTRANHSLKYNPKIDFDIGQLLFGGVEAGFIINIFRTAQDGNPPLAWVRSFIEDERLPTHLGWVRHPGTNLFNVYNRALESMAASPELWPLVGVQSVMRYFTPGGLREFLGQRFTPKDLKEVFDSFREEFEKQGGNDLGPFRRLQQLISRL